MAVWSLDEKLFDPRNVGFFLLRRPSNELTRRCNLVISQLAELFYHLEHADGSSVTPTIELAKLALVTSKDEEEEEISDPNDKGGGTDSSNDTDATLVDEGPSSSRYNITASPTTSSQSILGKRPRNGEDQKMDVDEPSTMATTSGAANPLDDDDDDIQMISRPGTPTTTGTNKTPPVLPPRKRSTADTTMAFGKFRECPGRQF